MGKAENVVNKQQHILSFHIAEILRHGKTAERHTHTGAGRLVHLAIDQCSLIDDPAFLHLVVEIVALTRTLAHAGEYRNAAMLFSNVVNQLHDNDCLADTSAAKQANLAALGIWRDQVDDLDASFQNFGRGFLLLIRRRGPVNWPTFFPFDRWLVIHRLAEQVKDAPKVFISYRHSDWATGIGRLHAAHQAVC